MNDSPLTDAELIIKGIFADLKTDHSVDLSVAVLFDCLQESVGDDSVVVLRALNYRVVLYRSGDRFYCQSMWMERDVFNFWANWVIDLAYHNRAAVIDKTVSELRDVQRRSNYRR